MPLLTALFDLHATATRKQALRVFAVLVLAMFVAALVEQLVPDFSRFAVPVLGLVYVWWWATAVRRLHDAGRSGAWALLLLIPVLGLLISVIVLSLRPSRPFNDGQAGLQLAGSFGLAFLALLAISRLIWAPHWVPAESMKPGLMVGDYLMVRHVPADRLVRGDVVVFRHPATGDAWVKRLVGLPGDVVTMQDGQVVLNDQTLPQTAAGSLREVYAPQGPLGSLPRCVNAVVGVGAVCEKQLFVETMPDGRAYGIANIEQGAFSDDIGPFIVPQGQMFLLGDNRDNSADSRFAQGAGGLGFVSMENVIGRVSRVIFSSAGPSLWAVWDWRADRIFRSVE
ncbi:signal peptidase I [Tabrizicola sp.]|uniref:signal peptidase I n=1 Tax=Tabrizicola sp. TaxID=2005166 RepID=UPI003D290F67